MPTLRDHDEITVNRRPRITDTPSLYTLGPAYAIAPAKVEKFLAANWPAVSGLFTDHGPWEGFNVTRQEPIRFQTTAHTLSLALGLLGTGSEQMARYLESKGLTARLDALGGSARPLSVRTCVRRRAALGAHEL